MHSVCLQRVSKKSHTLSPFSNGYTFLHWDDNNSQSKLVSNVKANEKLHFSSYCVHCNLGVHLLIAEKRDWKDNIISESNECNLKCVWLWLVKNVKNKTFIKNLSKTFWLRRFEKWQISKRYAKFFEKRFVFNGFYESESYTFLITLCPFLTAISVFIWT